MKKISISCPHCGDKIHILLDDNFELSEVTSEPEGERISVSELENRFGICLGVSEVIGKNG